VVIIKSPKVHSLPDIVSVAEIARLLKATRHLRFRVFYLTTYSPGLRRGEALALEAGDVDAGAERVHVREAKGGKDRFVPLPAWTLVTLRRHCQHHPHLYPHSERQSMKAWPRFLTPYLRNVRRACSAR
jgi:integrase